MSDAKPEKPITVLIDAAEKRAGLPPIAEAQQCHRPDCPPSFEMGFGLAGGGFGPYVFCDVCGQIRGKDVYDE